MDANYLTNRFELRASQFLAFGEFFRSRIERITMIIKNLLILISTIVLNPTAFGQSDVALKIPESLESIESKTEFRYCSQWLSCKGGKEEQGKKLLESLEKDKIEIPYRWRSAFEASLDSDYQLLEGGGLNAAIVLLVRRKKLSEDLGEVLLLNDKVTIRLPPNTGYGGGYSVPQAVLDQESCYLITNSQGSQILITKLETKVGTKVWETTIPLVYSPGAHTGPAFSDGFQDVQFIDRDGERMLFLWNHFAGEYAFAELSCKDGSIRTYFSTEIAKNRSLTRAMQTK